MKLTRKQLRKLIQESYRKLHRQQAKLAAQGHTSMRISGPISLSPSKRYYEALRSFLYHDQGINSQKKGPTGMKDNYSLSNDHELAVPTSRSWPQGFTIVRNYLFNQIKASMPNNSTHGGIYCINFSATGNPEVDAEFIAKLSSLSDDDFLRIGAKTKGPARVGSWESEIISGYPHNFIGLPTPQQFKKSLK